MAGATLEMLRQVPLFAPLGAARLADVDAMAQRRRFRRGEVLFHRGDPGSMLYVLLGGRVRIYSPSEDGSEMVLAILGPGEFFGELSLLDGLPRSASAQAIEECDALVIGRDEFHRFLRQHPGASIAVLGVLSRRLRRTDELLEDAAFLDVPGRLAKRLLELMDSNGEPVDGGTLIRLRLTHAELAAMVGATRESITKAMKRFARAGLLEAHGHFVVVRSPEGLRRRVS
ncbi:MAG: Crp/Fnr family transcriptional regulator [Chloroflexi bacterium]|nr:Crp/Fnr family transcriptional regulator [Chloroflexota bacterium]